MCLAIPGQIIEILPASAAPGCGPELTRTGKVRFEGIVKEVNLAFVPEAVAGDYVIVHVGMALNTIDEDEARKALEDFKAMEEAADEEWRNDEVSG